MITLDNISGRLTPPHLDTVYVCEKNNLKIGRDEYIAIVGESGSGKTQLVKTMAAVNEDYFELTNGTLNYNFNNKDQISFDPGLSTDKCSYSEIKNHFSKNNIYGERIGMMFQNPSTCFNPFWTVGQHFDEIQKLQVESVSSNKNFVEFKKHLLHILFKETCTEIVMQQFLNKNPKNLSGGQKQRLIIALVIVRKPDLIIGDEIGTGIDLKIKKDIYNLLLDFRKGKEYGDWQPSLILISHDIGFAYKIVDKIYIMYRGTIVQKLNLISKNKNKIPLSTILDDNKTILHPYTRALLASVVSRTFNLVDTDPPNLTIRNDTSCPYHLVCRHKPDDEAQCTDDFIDERTVNVDDMMRCVHSKDGIIYGSIDDDNYDWKKGWQHLERENNPVILEVKMNGHKIGQSDILHPYEKVIQIRKNEILGLVGESGSGKTTLGKIIVGYPEYSTQRDSSVIYYDESGQEYNYTDYRIRKKLGYPIQIIHQDPQFSLNPNMTVKESLIESIKIGLVKIKGEYSSIDLNKSLNKYCDALAFSEKLLNKQIKTLSGGQQRRLGIGRVFALKPRVIIADEPVASLDSIIKNGIFQLFTYDDIHNLGFLLDNDEFTDTAMMLISHDLKSIDRYCSRMLVMEKGYIREEVFNHLGPGFKAKEEYTKGLYADFQFFDLPSSEIS